MKNKLFLAGILAFMLVFGMVVVGCNNSTDNSTGNGEIVIDGWTWTVGNDSFNGGTSTIAMEKVVGSNRLKFTGNLTTDFDGHGYAVCYALPNNTNQEALRNSNGFSFKCKGDGKSYVVEVTTLGITDYCWYRSVFEASETEKTIEILYEDLYQLDWGTQVEFDKSKITSIQFMAATGETGVGSFSFTIGDIHIGVSD